MDFDASIEVPTDQELQQWTLELPAKAGVYLLWGTKHEPILLATTGAIRSAVRRKLAQDPDQSSSRRAKLAEITKGGSWTKANSSFVAYVQFHELARKIYPQSYRKMLGFSDAWWVKVRLSERFGRLLATRKLDVSEEDQYIGPMTNAKAAKSFIDLATDMYGLCRDYEVLQQMAGNKGTKACTYAQMGKCCGVCQGKISASEYRQRLLDVVSLAGSEGRLRQREQLEEQMNQAAQRLEFERAANNKKLLKRLAGLESDDYYWTGRLSDFEFLIIAPGIAPGEIWPWKLKADSIEAGKAVKLTEVQEKVEQIVNWANQDSGQVPTSRADIQRWREKIALMSYLLFRSHNDRCLYYKLDNVPQGDDLAKQITEKFSKSKASKGGQNTDLKSTPKAE